MTATPLVRITWAHPVHGRVTETACPDHQRIVTLSLRTLGVGCIAGPEPHRDECDRCTRGDEPARPWLADRARGCCSRHPHPEPT